MHPTESHGLDGLLALFFQKYWTIARRDVTNLALDILNHDRNPADINSTFTTLIPKHKNPSPPKDFRPISTCNFVMKVITLQIELKEICQVLLVKSKVCLSRED